MESLLFRAIILGAIYTLASIGLSLQWGVLRNLNFSHGASITFGAYVMWVALSAGGLGYTGAFIIMILMTFLLGVFIEWISIRPFFGKNEVNVFIGTVALSTILAQTYFILFGGRGKYIDPAFDGIVQLGSLRATYHEFFILIVSLVTLLVMWLILTKTKVGLSIRAVSQDQLGSVLIGINTRRVYSITMGVATILAGIAGALLGPILYVEPHMGELPMVKAFVIVILGGIGSFRGTIAAAFIVALVEVMVGSFVGVEWAPLSLFLMMVLILIFKPEGLFGVSERKA